jgi:hypothetical protein
MLAMAHLAADIASSIALSDRTEIRLRQPGDSPPGASFDMATTPDARLVLRSPRMDLTLDYGPRLTFWDVNDIGLKPTWLNIGSLRARWHTDNTSLALTENASYGASNFSGLAIPLGPDGTTVPRVDVVPPAQVIEYESSSTTLDARASGRRWDFRSTAGYQLSGGADDAARTLIPLQRGPFAEADVTLWETPVDHFTTTATGEDTTFSSGPAIVLVEADEGWKHLWSATTDTTATLGASAARVQASPSSATYPMNNPVAELALDQRILTADDRVTLKIAARLGPVINRLLGVVDERVQGTVLSKWTHGPFVVSALANVQQSVFTDTAYSTELFVGELTVSYVASDIVTLDGGVRGVWQQGNQPVGLVATPSTTDIAEINVAQGTVFLGATFRAPTIGTP